jgi:threonine dehydratase
VIGAEPRIANDASRSLQAGRRIANETEPQTICDGARTLSLGVLNFEILQKGLAGIEEVEEHTIKRAVRLLHETLTLKAEPTGALALAVLLQHPERFAGKQVACIVSGGNVDDAVHAACLQ